MDRLKDLGSDHPLAILVHPLQKTERKHKTAIKEHKVAITEWDTIIEQEKVAHRITSYNVCYTKLLRTIREKL